MNPSETRGEFEARYSKPQGVFWGRDLISLPCNCEDGGGPWHWAAVKNSPEDIARHNAAYGPFDAQTLEQLLGIQTED